jgi:hypothetical protein
MLREIESSFSGLRVFGWLHAIKGPSLTISNRMKNCIGKYLIRPQKPIRFYKHFKSKNMSRNKMLR